MLKYTLRFGRKFNIKKSHSGKFNNLHARTRLRKGWITLTARFNDRLRKCRLGLTHERTSLRGRLSRNTQSSQRFLLAMQLQFHLSLEFDRLIAAAIARVMMDDVGRMTYWKLVEYNLSSRRHNAFSLKRKLPTAFCRRGITPVSFSYKETLHHHNNSYEQLARSSL